MRPLRVTAHLRGQIRLEGGTLALDALLMAAVCIRDRIPPLTVQQAEYGTAPAIEIPVARSECGRIYLASFATPMFDQHETRYTNRRFPTTEALHLSAMRRVNTSAGAQKSYRIPYSASHVEGDALTWYCVGDSSAVRQLLSLVHYLGKRRAVGLGRVEWWDVAPCEPWEGFPVARAGRPLRPLPLDWPGLTEYAPGYSTLTPPYWDRTREEACAVAV